MDKVSSIVIVFISIWNKVYEEEIGLRLRVFGGGIGIENNYLIF